ncbi:MAG: hypothetical protein ACE5JB_13910 [bacterium]
MANLSIVKPKQDRFYVSSWESRTNLFDEAVTTIGKVVKGAAIGYGVGVVWGGELRRLQVR